MDKSGFKISSSIIRLKSALSDIGGLVGKTRYFHALPRHHEQHAERLLALLQVTLVLAMAAVEGHGTADSKIVTAVIALLGVFWVSSLFRWLLAAREDVPDKVLDGLTVADVGIFLSIAAILQTTTAHPPGTAASGQIALWLGLLIALRMVRVHPRPLIVAAGAGFMGLLAVPALFAAIPQFAGISEARFVDIVESQEHRRNQADFYQVICPVALKSGTTQ